MKDRSQNGNSLHSTPEGLGEGRHKNLSPVGGITGNFLLTCL